MQADTTFLLLYWKYLKSDYSQCYCACGKSESQKMQLDNRHFKGLICQYVVILKIFVISCCWTTFLHWKILLQFFYLGRSPLVKEFLLLLNSLLPRLQEWLILISKFGGRNLGAEYQPLYLSFPLVQVEAEHISSCTVWSVTFQCYLWHLLGRWIW